MPVHAEGTAAKTGGIAARGANVKTASAPRWKPGNGPRRNTAKTVSLFFQWSLLGMLTSGFLAVSGSGELDWPTLGALLLAICLRASAIVGWVAIKIPARSITILSAIYAVLYPLDYLYFSRSFLTATVHMICFVAIAKILTARTERDYTFVKLIAILELLAAALLSIHLNFFIWLAAFLLFTIATFASGEVQRSMAGFGAAAPPGKDPLTPPLASSPRTSPPVGPGGFRRRLALLTCFLFVGVLTLTAGMFFVLPRTARAALQRFVPQRYHLPGFANEVTLGDLGELKQNSTPVMHVRAYQQREGQTSDTSEIPTRNLLLGVHWRGSALSRFDGKRWFNAPAPEERLRVERGELVLPNIHRTRPGRTIGYEVQLDEIASETLVFAGTPETISIPAVALWRSPSGALRAPRFGNRGLRYGTYSFLEYEGSEAVAPPPPLAPLEQIALLELPSVDSRVERLAREWTAGEGTREKQARAIESHLRRDFSYSLKMLDTPVADPLAYFLFVRKQGHCEYFASAMAVMLRSVGIPSRVATGFLGGVYNPMTGWQVVRASDAHSWVEAWIPGRGWTTFDPTPSDLTHASPGLWIQVALFLDTADQFWRDWVMDYDLDHQVVLASQIQTASRNLRFPAILETLWARVSGLGQQASLQMQVSWRTVIAEMLILLAIAGLLFGRDWLNKWHSSRQWRRVQCGDLQPSDATLVYERALSLLEQRGLQKPAWLTPDEFTRVQQSPELVLLMGRFTRAYNQVRFGGRRDAASQLTQLFKELELLLASSTGQRVRA